MNEPAIRVENLGKQYTVARPARGIVTPGRRDGESNLAGEAWALRNVCFTVERGEALGVVGNNGGGKTTLLKILSRITRPSEGRVEIRGRVGVLLDIGAGFHGELTGRENVQLFASILGMTGREIRIKYDEIVDFAEMRHAMSLPLKHFSTGMCARLAFAIAVHLDCEILLIDEVLALADHQYQQKCLCKLSDTARAGRAAVLVSHDVDFIPQLCQQALLLQGGRVAMSGSAIEVVACYRESSADPNRLARWKSCADPRTFKCN